MYGGDNIPALLTGGEFVMNKDTVDNLGVDFFEALNARKYQEGGYVGDSAPQRTGTDIGGNRDLVNNINITVNVDKDGASTTSTRSSSTGQSLSEEQRSRALGEMVNAAVLETIIEQKRPGGLLYD